MSERRQPSAISWRREITTYQWLALAIASAGWIFDAFEGQLFMVTRDVLLSELLHQPSGSPDVKWWGEALLGAFLLGGTAGGLLFSSMADRWGRKPVMCVTILFYSLFSGLTYFITNPSQLVLLRFLVAMGVGGEWAVGAALVAEIFPCRARSTAASAFHGSSIMGVWLAGVVGILVGSNWREAYLWSAIPALLATVVRPVLKEPERWQLACGTHRKALGSYVRLLGSPDWRGRAIFGMLLASVGMATFWGVAVAGQDLMRELLIRNGMDTIDARREAQFAYAWIQSAGAGLGMLSFGPISQRLGRRKCFLLFHLMAVVVAPAICWLPQTKLQMECLMPLLGFSTLGIHAGYAVYFPELFPNHLRATGAGFCFNTGRFLAAPMLWISANLKSGMDLRSAITILSTLFLLGIVVLAFLPETKNEELPD